MLKVLGSGPKYRLTLLLDAQAHGTLDGRNMARPTAFTVDLSSAGDVAGILTAGFEVMSGFRDG